MNMFLIILIILLIPIILGIFLDVFVNCLIFISAIVVYLSFKIIKYKGCSNLTNKRSKDEK